MHLHGDKVRPHAAAGLCLSNHCQVRIAREWGSFECDFNWFINSANYAEASAPPPPSGVTFTNLL